MRVLVTGSEGYIGTRLVPMLVEAGHDITGLDTGLFDRCVFGSYVPTVPLIHKDIRDTSAADFEGFDAVVHLAALSNDPMSELDPELTFEINYQAAVDVAARAKEAGVPRFVFSSTCSTYGFHGDDFITEESSFNPLTTYAVSKVRAESRMSEMADESFCPVFLRHGTAYGVSPKIRFDLVINNLVAWAITTKQVYLKSTGMSWRPLVHIGDISRAFIAAIEAPREAVFNEAFNIGATKENFRIREIAELVARHVPDCKVVFADGAETDTRSYRVDFSKAETKLPGFHTEWDVERGIQEVYEACRDIGLTGKEFEEARYSRIAHLKMLLAEKIVDSTLRPIVQQVAGE
jgi:nucleoside-diphosphate-sugar epimerase